MAREPDATNASEENAATTEPLKADVSSKSEGLKGIKGSAERTLVGTVIAGCLGLATAVLLATTRNVLKDRMPILETNAASNLLVSIPNLAGSIARIPCAMLLEKFSSKWLHFWTLIVCSCGIVGLMAVSFATQDYDTLSDGIYGAYLVFGFLGGIGLAVFSLGITTVAFWYPQKQQGAKNGIYGGATNLCPGIFALWVAKMMKDTSLGITYVTWLAILAVVIVVSTHLINDSPFHQVMFRKEEEMGAQARGDLKKKCRKQYGQEIFPAGNLNRMVIAAVKDPRTWMLVYIYNVTFGGFLAFTVYLPSYFRDYHAQEVDVAGYFGAVFTIIAALVRIPAGIFSDKVKFMDGGIFFSYVACIVIIAGSVIMMVATNEMMGVAIFGMIVLAFGCGIGNASTYKILPKFVPKTMAGSSGLVAGIGAFGGILFPVIMGAIADGEGTDPRFAFGFITGVGGLAFIMTIIVQWQMRKDDDAQHETESYTYSHPHPSEVAEDDDDDDDGNISDSIDSEINTRKEDAGTAVELEEVQIDEPYDKPF